MPPRKGNHLDLRKIQIWRQRIDWRTCTIVRYLAIIQTLKFSTFYVSIPRPTLSSPLGYELSITALLFRQNIVATHRHHTCLRQIELARFCTLKRTSDDLLKPIGTIQIFSESRAIAALALGSRADRALPILSLSKQTAPNHRIQLSLDGSIAPLAH